MTVSELQFTVRDKTLSAKVSQPDAKGSFTQKLLVVYAPGAGSNINDPFGAFLSDRLAEEGIATLRFQFPYMESGSRRPDSPGLLEETWREIISLCRSPDLGLPSGKLIIGGRSMGGRIASRIVAQGTSVDGLALFAYPLRPPSNPSQPRNEHFPKITVPTLFCSGTRDSFGTPEELKAAAANVPQATVDFLYGADHGFAVLKSSGRTREDVWREAGDFMLSWLRTLIE
jgi:predicted alpha/beta-hydrolase family hydrolase